MQVKLDYPTPMTMPPDISPPRFGKLVPGKLYAFPIKIKKVGKLQQNSDRTWNAVDIQMIPFNMSLLATKTINDPADPIGDREIAPMDREDVKRVMYYVARENYVPFDNVLVLDYHYYKTSTFEKPYVVVWWFPKEITLKNGSVKNFTPSLTKAESPNTASAEIVDQIIGSRKYAQVRGTRLERWNTNNAPNYIVYNKKTKRSKHRAADFVENTSRGETSARPSSSIEGPIRAENVRIEDLPNATPGNGIRRRFGFLNSHAYTALPNNNSNSKKFNGGKRLTRKNNTRKAYTRKIYTRKY